jgi:hypothetical protein
MYNQFWGKVNLYNKFTLIFDKGSVLPRNPRKLTLKAATTKSKLSPLLRPAAAYLCSSLNIDAEIFCMFSLRAGRSILKTQLMQ